MILFKAKREDNREWVEGDLVTSPNGLIKSILVNEPRNISDCKKYFILQKHKENKYYFANIVHDVDPKTVCMYTRLNDINNEKYFDGDIGEFDNGDRFVIEQEDWVEFRVVWIGEAECEDQARDFYRIERSKKIGNKFDN